MSKKENVASLTQGVKSIKMLAIITGVYSCLERRKSSDSAKVENYMKKNFPDFNITTAEVNQVITDLVTEGILVLNDGNFSDTRGIKGSVSPNVTIEVTEAKSAVCTRTNTPSTVKGKRISRTQAQSFIENNHGKFFTAKFITKKGKLRTLNGQFLKDSKTELGYVKVRETGKLKKGEEATRNVNLQTLEELTIGGKTFIVG